MTGPRAAPIERLMPAGRRAVEQILRRLVQRLCAVAKGDDQRVNSQLDKLAATTRRDSGATELQALFNSLTDTIMAAEKSAALYRAKDGGRNRCVTA